MIKKVKNRIDFEVSEEEITRRIAQIEDSNIDKELREFLITALKAIVRLDEIVGMKQTTIARLRKIFNKKIEKNPSKNSNDDSSTDGNNEADKKHGRGNNKGKNGKEAYGGAQKINHPHESLKSGDSCPECGIGKIYNTNNPGIHIRITGSAPLSAKIHETEKLRCNACGTIFEANFEGKNAPKYDARAIAIIAILKYGLSLPLYRLEKLQKQLYIPMPASTQWDLLEFLANVLHPLWKYCLKIAPEGDLFYQDDTKNRVLSLIKENKDKLRDKKARKAMYTSGIISVKDNRRIILYMTGRNYSGERLSELFEKRTETNRPIIMSDALATNKIKNIETVECFCSSHARRKFFDLNEKFEKESKFVLNIISEVYAVDNDCIARKLTDKERLEEHQLKSAPLMEKLKVFLDHSLDSKEVEPNSTLGSAMNYVINHWDGLTQFLKIPGAPLDNNLMENKLRLIVINRKNWMFYKTEMGALVGDIIVSICETAIDSKVNLFEYLVWLQENEAELKINPEKFLPWNFTCASASEKRQSV